MRKKALTAEERQIQVTNWFAIRIQHGNEDYASLYEIAKGIDQAPSTKLRFIVSNMVIKGILTVMDTQRPGRWAGRGYMLASGTFKRPAKQAIKCNSHINGIKQMELI
jgi:hypothetical protein